MVLPSDSPEILNPTSLHWAIFWLATSVFGVVQTLLVASALRLWHQFRQKQPGNAILELIWITAPGLLTTSILFAVFQTLLNPQQAFIKPLNPSNFIHWPLLISSTEQLLSAFTTKAHFPSQVLGLAFTGIIWQFWQTRQESRLTDAPEENLPKKLALILDYLSLTKPKVVLALLFTTLGAMFVSNRGAPPFSLICWTLLGGYLAAGGASAINCALDYKLDCLMQRTKKRPVPRGRISPKRALWFGIGLIFSAFLLLATFTTLLAALLAMLGVVYYSLVYTRWLKLNTWQNIVIGGGAGAIPTLVGWAAVTGKLQLPAMILFILVFYWTPPHFWALALLKQADYACAGVPMLPIIAGEKEARWQILLYSILMVCLSFLLTPLQGAGLLYLALALGSGTLFIIFAWQVWASEAQRKVWQLYSYSMFYIAFLFSAMILDRTMGY